MTALFEDTFDMHDPEEVHWSASTILTIFFAASLVSAVFFSLGYSFGGAGTGKHPLTFNSAQARSSPQQPTIQKANASPLTASNQPSPMTNPAGHADDHPVAPAPSTVPVVLRRVSMTPADHTAAPVVEKPSAPPPSVRHDDSTAGAKSSAHIMVQVGAIGDRKDAERLVAELRRKGFHAGIYQVRSDKFMHVQIGPFKDTAQAQRERHQVMASGFHAILKSS